MSSNGFGFGPNDNDDDRDDAGNNDSGQGGQGGQGGLTLALSTTTRPSALRGPVLVTQLR